MQQIAAVEFLHFIERLRIQLNSKFASDADKNNKAIRAAEVFAKLDYVPRPDPAATPEDIEATRKVADLVVQKLKIEPSKIWEEANGSGGIDSRTNKMLVYANLSAATPLRRAWAFNNAADNYLKKCNFHQALEWSKLALTAADDVQSLNPELSAEMRDLRAKSAWSAAVAAGRLGNSREAATYRALAVKNNSARAKSQSTPTPRVGC